MWLFFSFIVALWLKKKMLLILKNKIFLELKGELSETWWSDKLNFSQPIYNQLKLSTNYSLWLLTTVTVML